MKALGWVLAVLLAVGWLASEWTAADSPQPVAMETPWRRTANGWERLEAAKQPDNGPLTPVDSSAPRRLFVGPLNHSPAPLVNPGFHPSLLAALLALSSVLALGLFSTEPEPRRRTLVIWGYRARGETAAKRRQDFVKSNKNRAPGA